MTIEEKLKDLEEIAKGGWVPDPIGGGRFYLEPNDPLRECLAMFRYCIEQRNGWRLNYQNAVGITFTHRAEVAASEDSKLLKAGEG